MCFGALLIAIVQWCRICLRLFEKHFRRISGNAKAAKFILCIADCCLACFERIVKFLTTHAYVMTAMTSSSLIPGARYSMSLLIGNLNVLGVNVLGDVVITIGKLLLTALNCFFAYLWLNHKTYDRLESHNYWIMLFIVAILTYFITSVFATVFDICIDSTMLCFCYDMEHNDGTSKPYYFPTTLRDHIGHAHSRKGGVGAKESSGNESKKLLD
jgi:hypothetical protein